MFTMSLLGSTYIFEQIFSHMKYTENKIRTKILDEHPENTLRIATTCIKKQISMNWKNKLS